MDTHDYPSMPNLFQQHARLAANSRRVQEVVDGHLNNIERLFDATTAEDWSVVGEVSQFLAELSPEGENGNLVHIARKVCDELRQEPTGPHGPAHLAKLLAECRAVQLRRGTR